MELRCTFGSDVFGAGQWLVRLLQVRCLVRHEIHTSFRLVSQLEICTRVACGVLCKGDQPYRSHQPENTMLPNIYRNLRLLCRIEICGTVGSDMPGASYWQTHSNGSIPVEQYEYADLMSSCRLSFSGALEPYCQFIFAMFGLGGLIDLTILATVPFITVTTWDAWNVWVGHNLEMWARCTLEAYLARSRESWQTPMTSYMQPSMYP